MSKIQIYDKAMCCSTGVCGPQVDPTLPRFAADLEWLSGQGHVVQRFNLAQEPAEFAKSIAVQQMLANEGVECLPIVLVDDVVVSRGEYPQRDDLAFWAGASAKSPNALPMASDAGGCCGGSGCC